MGARSGGPKDASVPSWIKLPEGGPDGPWHLEAPPTIRRQHITTITHTACGRSFSPSEPERLERADHIDGIPEAERCPACQAIYANETRQAGG
jgi:hypothetical protein